MENALIRIVAAFCAGGGMGFFWLFGAFVSVPWREERMLSLNRIEWQAIGVPLVAGLLTAWAAQHLFGLADRQTHPRLFRAFRAAVALASFAAATAGMMWTRSV